MQSLSHDVMSEQQYEDAEFEDLGSSKRKPGTEDDEEHENVELEKETFETHWFSFERTIDENDLI